MMTTTTMMWLSDGLSGAGTDGGGEDVQGDRRHRHHPRQGGLSVGRALTSLASAAALALWPCQQRALIRTNARKR
eukprot:1959030-Rhodomonas_salina.4